MSNILKFAALFSLLSVVNFLLFAFYNVSFDISTWSGDGRFFCCFSEIFVVWASCVVVHIQNNTV